MSRRPLVAANWKMHGQKAQVESLVQGYIAGLAELGGLDVLVCPAYVFLTQLREAFAGSPLLLGAQDLHQELEGAYTGEVSGGMLRDAGCSHVIVGHSERREYAAESDALVARKFAVAQQQGLVPLLCVGETQSQRESDATAEVVCRQLRAVIESCGIEAFDNAIIAYEPVWAIGTGLTASPQQAQEVHALIRSELAAHEGVDAASVRILYGGSVKAANAAELFAQPDIDGALVGGASLLADEFAAICRAASGLNA